MHNVGATGRLAISRFFRLLVTVAILSVGAGISLADGELYEKLCEQDGRSPSSSVVILGASYAKDWPIESIAEHTAINKGIGGNQSFEMLSRFQSDVIEIHPVSVIIWGFINDIHRSPPEELEETAARIRRSYVEMIEEADRHGLRVIVVTEVTLPQPEGFANWLAGLANRVRGKIDYRSMVNSHVLEVNAWLREFTRSKDILVLEFQETLSDANGWRRNEYAMADGTHLTSEAYDALTQYTAEAIGAICGAATP